MEQRITIKSEFITLGQFLKFAYFINNGGESKAFIESNKILVNNEIEKRRGRKLKEGDRVLINGVSCLICTSKK